MSLFFEVSGGEVRLLDLSSLGAGGPCTALFITFVIAVPLNAIVIVVIFRTFLRAHIFNLLLASFCCAILLDAAVNIPIFIVFRASWAHLVQWLKESTVWLCRFSAGFVQWTPILQVGCLVLLVAHRLSGVSKSENLLSSPPPQKKSKLKRYSWLTVLLWTVSTSLLVPVIAGVHHVRYFEERYSCSPINVTLQASTLAASVTVLTLGQGIPYLLLIIMWIILIVRIKQERQRKEKIEMLALQRAVATGSPVRGFGNSYDSSNWQVWGSDNTSAGNGLKFVILLAILSCLQFTFVFPQVIYNISTQFTYPTQPQAYHSTLVDLSFVPVTTPWYDATFTWLRIMYTIIAPIAILVTHESLRLQIIQNIFWCNHMKYSQLSPVQSVSAFLDSRNTGKRKRNKSKFQKSRDGTIPVLFVTNEGIHMRQPRANPESQPIIFADLALKQKGEKLKKINFSPHQKKKTIPMDLNLIEEDEITPKPKKGKSVRFSGNVSEIPVKTFEKDTQSMLGGKVQVRENASVGPLMAILDSKPSTADKYDIRTEKVNRRGSEPLVNFRKKDKRSLELDLANSSLSSSTSSLLLSLSQRFRNRDS